MTSRGARAGKPQVGQRCALTEHNGEQATIRFVGTTKFAPGNLGKSFTKKKKQKQKQRRRERRFEFMSSLLICFRLVLSWIRLMAKNDGSVQGVKYFDVKEANAGLFCQTKCKSK
jgi:hypothetical protein